MILKIFVKNPFLRKIMTAVLSFFFGSSYNVLNICTTCNILKRLKAYRDIMLASRNWENTDSILLRAQKGKHQGQRCFILCNGPSLNKTDLQKIKTEVTFGANAIYLNYDRMGFYPTYYVVEDNLVAEDRAAEISKLDKVKIKFFPVRLSYCLKRDQKTILLNHCPDFLRGKDNNFSPDISKYTGGGNTVTYTCLQIAFYMGFNEIYIIGADHDYKIPERYVERGKNENYIINSREDDVNHFCKEYFGNGYRWHNPKVHQMEDAYRNARKFLESNNVRVFNATSGGHLEIFKRINFDRLF